MKEKRTATLRPKKFGSIVPIWAWGLCLLTTLLVVTTSEEPKKQITTIASVLFCILMANHTEKKSKVSQDLEDDELYRVSEVWTIFLIACSFPIFLPLGNYLGHNGVDAVFSTIPIVAFVIFLRSKTYKNMVK